MRTRIAHQNQGERHDLRRMQERLKRNDFPFTLLHALLNKIKNLLLLSLRCHAKWKIKRDKAYVKMMQLCWKKNKHSRERLHANQTSALHTQRGNEGKKKRFHDFKHWKSRTHTKKRPTHTVALQKKKTLFRPEVRQ